MLINHRRYRIVSDSAAITAAVMLILAQWLAPQAIMPEAENTPLTVAVAAPDPLPADEQAAAISFSDLMLDLGLLLFFNR